MRQRACDLRTTVRGLVRNPWFSLIAVGALSLGLVANVLIFSIVNAVRRGPAAGVSTGCAGYQRDQ